MGGSTALSSSSEFCPVQVGRDLLNKTNCLLDGTFYIDVYGFLFVSKVRLTSDAKSDKTTRYPMTRTKIFAHTRP